MELWCRDAEGVVLARKREVLASERTREGERGGGAILRAEDIQDKREHHWPLTTMDDITKAVLDSSDCRAEAGLCRTASNQSPNHNSFFSMVMLSASTADVLAD